MAEPLSLSQAAWTVIDMLQDQLGVAIEVLDMSMRPLRAAAATDVPSALDEPRIAAEALKSLRTGELRIDRTTGTPIGIFPLRMERQVAGCLVVSARAAGARAVPAVEPAGYLARTALESDLALTTQLGDARFRNRRVQGILRFLSQLGGEDCEREVMNAVIQAATVWFDVDCRVYQRQPDDSFALAAMLPGVEQRPASVVLDKARVDKLVSSRRFPSGGDLDDLGLVGRREEVLVLPVGPPTSAPEWLLILAGVIDQEVELTFSAIARMLAGDLAARESKRLETWQDLLARTASGGHSTVDRTLLTLLGALGTEVAATAARVTLLRGQSERVLAALGPAESAGEGVADAHEEPPTISYAVPVAPDAAIRLDISTRGDRRQAALQAASWIRALRPWLREAAAGLTAQASLFEAAVEGPSFEQRIQEEVERAKRFNLGLGLVLIGPAQGAGGDATLEPLLDAVRSELRASDLMGRIRGGLVAVVLVHADPGGAASVTTRLQRRLRRLPEEARIRVVQLGRAVFSAECGSADALIAQALREARRFELRN